MAKGQGQKGRKLGRMEAWCKGYAAAGTVDKNRMKRMRRHIASFPNDTQARERYGANAFGIQPNAKGKRVQRQALICEGRQLAAIAHAVVNG